ncbi:MAG: tRNA (adenosine(37)-N6)-dimethylallyltransferase MiaA, partial [Lachnospiraceae bacterium]|nr:tRNA (adenosine(37)-N6)-dimethylallyltransferase MiaA [Lachnospiraceae bacterium]
MPEKQKLIILTGPTAAGKTALSIRLAEKLGGEIISADSMQVYRFMDIGSAKVTAQEMGGIRHHLVDVLDPREDFDVYTFQTLAKEALCGIYGRGHLPIVVGGTGFYIQALLYDIDFDK